MTGSPRACEKIRYPTERAAKNAALRFALKNMRQRGGANVMRAYRCPFCGAWHLTNQPLRGVA